jgi:hypothetical protein
MLKAQCDERICRFARCEELRLGGTALLPFYTSTRI